MENPNLVEGPWSKQLEYLSLLINKLDDTSKQVTTAAESVTRVRGGFTELVRDAHQSLNESIEQSQQSMIAVGRISRRLSNELWLSTFLCGAASGLIGSLAAGFITLGTILGPHIPALYPTEQLNKAKKLTRPSLSQSTRILIDDFDKGVIK